MCDTSNSQALKQEIKVYLEILKVLRKTNRQHKLLLEIIKECDEQDRLKLKIKHIIYNGKALQGGFYYNGDTFDTPLGVSLDSKELTHTENDKLFRVLKTNLEEKCNRLNNNKVDQICKAESSLNVKEDECSIDLLQEDQTLFDLAKKLDLEQKLYEKQQLEILELLETQKDTRLEVVCKTTEDKCEEFRLISKINYLKAELAKAKCRVEIFLDTTHSFKAFEQLMKDLEEQKHELKEEIGHLKDLKSKYDQVTCKEYNDILKSYLQYKSSLEKKKMMFDMFKSKKN